MLVVSDHGFKTAQRFVRPIAVLRRMGLLTPVDGKIVCDAYSMAAGGSAMVYVTNSAKKKAIAQQLKAAFAEVEGVERVLTPHDFGSWDLPDPLTSDRMADLVLIAKEDYAFTDSLEPPELVVGPGAGYPGHHGYPATDPQMNTTFIAWGFGIRAGAPLGNISHLDVGPTIAALFGLEMTKVEGRVLREILVPEPLSSK